MRTPDNLIIKIPKLKPEICVQSFSEVYDWGLRDLHIPEIHKQTLGENVKIAVVDSGKSEHFELKENTINAKNFANAPSVNDQNGHSTACSGLIAAAKDDQGIVGVAPKSKIVFAKAIDDAGRGSPSALVNAVNWSISQQVDIISISAGLFTDFKPLHKAIQKAYNQNIIVVAAVGNTGNRYYDVAFPARYPETIGVGAYDIKHTIAKFSSRGINVNFAMPGVDIYTCWLNDSYAKLNGSSFAAPIMTGICALILSKHRNSKQSNTPCETPKQMLEHLIKYAINIGNKNETGFGTVDTRSMFAKGI